MAAGPARLDPFVQRRPLETLAAGAKFGEAQAATPGAVGGGLIAREAEVLIEMEASHSTTEIAIRLFVSEATVKTDVNHLLAKTGRIACLRSVCVGR